MYIFVNIPPSAVKSATGNAVIKARLAGSISDKSRAVYHAHDSANSQTYEQKNTVRNNRGNTRKALILVATNSHLSMRLPQNAARLRQPSLNFASTGFLSISVS